MCNWKIREATLKDSEDLEVCMHLAYKNYEEIMQGEFLPPLHSNYKEEVENYSVWVIEENEEIVAGIILVFENNYASIANVAVHPNMQGKGIGKFLIDFAEKVAKEKGYIEINLATHKLLVNNILFYEKLGWIKYGGEDNKIYMKKNIIVNYRLEK